MSRSLALAYPLPAPPAEIVALLRDEQFVRQRLAVLPARSAELVAHDISGETVVTVVASTFPRSVVPRLARGFLIGEPRFRRTETWAPDADGFAGTIGIDLAGTPSNIAVTMSLRPTSTGSDLVLRGEVSIPVPVIGPQVEPVVERHVVHIADAEADFLVSWLSGTPRPADSPVSPG